MVPVLLLGLAACNNNDDAALDTTNNNNGTNVVNRDNNNNLYRVNNRTDYGFDHQGPLTEDYTNDRNNNNNNRATRYDNNNKLYRLNNNGTTRSNNNNNLYNMNNRGTNAEDYTNDWNRNKNSTWNDNNDNNSVISNYSTPMSSKQYPHTRAVLIQEARYQFLPTNPRQDTRQQAQLRQKRQATAQAPTQTQQQQQATQAPAQQQQQAAPATNSQAVQQVIDLTNAQRRQNGLPALVADAKLNSVAHMKSADMQQYNYFSHTSPTYGSPFDMMRDNGVSYKSAGENIAQGQRTPQEVVQAWMNSEGHRKNILSRDFTHIGVGYDAQGHHWTQMFIKK